MPVYKNITTGITYLHDENGVRFEIKAGDTFTGSAYFRRYCTGSMPLLRVVTEDGSVWGGPNQDQQIYGQRIDVPGGAAYTDPGMLVDFREHFDNPASTLSVKNTSDDDGPTVLIRLNGQDNALVHIDAGDTFTSERGELLIKTLELSNSSEQAAQVDIVATGK